MNKMIEKLKPTFMLTWTIPKLNGIILFGSAFSECIYFLSFIYCNGEMRNQLPVKYGVQWKLHINCVCVRTGDVHLQMTKKTTAGSWLHRGVFLSHWSMRECIAVWWINNRCNNGNYICFDMKVKQILHM